MDTSAQHKSNFLPGMKMGRRSEGNQSYCRVGCKQCNVWRGWKDQDFYSTCDWWQMHPSLCWSHLSSPRASALGAVKQGLTGTEIQPWKKGNHHQKVWFRAARQAPRSHSPSTNFRRLIEDDYPSLLFPSAWRAPQQSRSTHLALKAFNF